MKRGAVLSSTLVSAAAGGCIIPRPYRRQFIRYDEKREAVVGLTILGMRARLMAGTYPDRRDSGEGPNPR